MGIIAVASTGILVLPFYASRLQEHALTIRRINCRAAEVSVNDVILHLTPLNRVILATLAYCS